MESFEDFFNKYYSSVIGRCKGKTYLLNFHLDLLYSQEIKKLCTPGDWNNYGFIINLIPKERRNDLQGMLIVGFSLKDAYDTLKETYNF